VREFDGIITDSSLSKDVRERIEACGGKFILPAALKSAI